CFFFFQAEDGIRDYKVTGVQTCALPICNNEPQDIGILGEDPRRTILRWDGPSGAVMLDYGAWYARMGRITFDGQGRAGTAIAHGPRFVTENEFADMVFQDVGLGIEAGAPGGQGIAETAVLR